ncbi:MAG TPA: pantoate--beta-alanine ligase [Terriglobales bacterium]|nr:pantoate--beta-alanine ligase [Terriglobales bacterium]
MHRIHTIAEMKSACRRLAGKTLGFVPTMGALHEGHLSLVRASKSRCDVTAVSIFVNPLQFGPSEDLARYPRTLDRDASLLQELGVDLLFAPGVDQMYSSSAKTYVLVDELSNKLDGASRPGHFRGVATVVAKLFEIVRPDYAFFGQKDAAQVAVLRKMVSDLNMDVELVVCPIVREQDGLAMSSRNAYLTPEQRRQALVLNRSLLAIQAAAEAGEYDTAKLIEIGKQVIAEEPGARLDYFAIVDPDTLDPIPDVSRDALLAVAAYVGPTRLIDNVVLASGPKRSNSSLRR